MGQFPKHTIGSDCKGCEERLKDAHPLIESFFHQIKDEWPDAHCSWVYRGEESQNEAFKSGMSKLQFPHSKHNTKPARAIDLFQINNQGKAVFDPRFGVLVKARSEELGFKLRWGGEWKSLGDNGHFELIDG